MVQLCYHNLMCAITPKLILLILTRSESPSARSLSGKMVDEQKYDSYLMTL